MSEIEQKQLAIRPSSTLRQINPGATSVLSGVVSDALRLARASQHALSAARIKVGKCEFREQDYKQLQIWAAALSMSMGKETSVEDLADVLSTKHIDESSVKHRNRGSRMDPFRQPIFLIN